MKNEDLVVEYVLIAPVEDVWSAITIPKKMKEWYFDIPDFKPEVSSQFQFSAGSEQKKYLHKCRIMEVIPHKKISYTWSYVDLPGMSLVSFELFHAGTKTRLKLTHSGLLTFPQDLTDFNIKSFTAGWNQLIGKNLKTFVEK